MIKILISDDIDKEGLKKLSKGKYLIEFKPGINNSEIIKNYKNFDVLAVRSIRKVDRELLSKTGFQIIATATKGTDHIDVEFAQKKNILVINAEEGNHISAAEHTLGLIINIFKRINYSDKLVREGNFSFYGYDRYELYGKKIGIIGFGKVGGYVGKLSKAFGMEVFANDTDKSVAKNNPDFNFKNLNYIFKHSDVITIHIPMSKKNHGFISKKKLDQLNSNVVLINTSRGDVIDEVHLIDLLKKKKIRYAGLDVFINEPNVHKGFRKLENVLLTNHIAGKTKESKRRISESIFSQINKIYSKSDL